MADTELAVSLAMASLLDLLSKSKDILTDKNLTAQISDSISRLKEEIMNKRRRAYHNQQTRKYEESLLLLALNAERIAQELLVRLLRDHMLKSQLVRLFSGTNRVCARDFRAQVTSPLEQLKRPWPAAENGQQDNETALPLLFSERVESHIVGRDESVNLLVTNLIGPTTPRPVPPPFPNAPPPDANIPPPDANAPPPADVDDPPPPDANAPPPPADANVPPPPDQDANAPPPPADANAPPPPDQDANAPPPPDANAPPPPDQDANAPPPPDANAPPPPDQDANIPPPDANAPPADADIPPPDANAPPPDANIPPADANAPPPPADANVPPPPDQDANAPPPPADANAPPPPDQDANAPPPPDANAPPPPDQDANIPQPDANAPPPPDEDANAPPTDADIPPPDANAPPPADANIPPAEANAPPPPDANIPPAEANAPPPVPPPDPNNTPLQVIAVVGRENCGKTALLRSVFNMLKIKHHFDCRAWVRVTDVGAESWTESLLVDILLQMPVRDQPKDLKRKNKEQLIYMLYGLLMEKRYLIVLDNLGDTLFNDFLSPFADSTKGSRVIVTSKEVIKNTAHLRIHYVPLSPNFTDEECRTLLLDSFTGGGDISQELMTSILNKCRRSAPEISLLGGLLSAVAENKRVSLVDRLGESPTLNHIMRSSFDELPYEMKPCVLYMALFPKESEVPTRRLFQLWAAEGLLAEVAADRSVQMRSAEDCFRELERRNLIRVVRRKPDTSARSCRMPAFLHEFFRQKAQASALLQIQHSPNAEQNAPHQPNQAQNTATGHYDYMVRYLRSVASFNTRKPGTHAREIKDLLNSQLLDGRPDLLRVLDLEGVHKPVLHEGFGNELRNLRYLGLRRTVLDSIPESVGNLLLLETLDLKHTNITKVTSAIWNAKNLRHLYLSEASFNGFIPRHISSESKLETLWGLFIETPESPMIRVLPKLQRLKKLGVTCRPGVARKLTRCISKLAGLKSLRLRSRDLFGQPAVLELCEMTGLILLSNLYLLGWLRPEQNPCSFLPLNLKRLTLSMSGCKDDPMPFLQSLNHLIDLRLLARSCSMKKLYCNAGFPELRVLKIWMLEELEELKVEQGAMHNLKELDIRQCKELKEVTGLIHINGLKFVSLTRVKEVLDPRRADGIRVHHDTLVKTTELIPSKDPPPIRRPDIYKGGLPYDKDEN